MVATDLQLGPVLSDATEGVLISRNPDDNRNVRIVVHDVLDLTHGVITVVVDERPRLHVLLGGDDRDMLINALLKVHFDKKVYKRIRSAISAISAAVDEEPADEGARQ
jgi:hypothetical protein